MGILKFLPYERFTLVSNLSAEEIKKRLYDHIVAGESTLDPYKGQIAIDSFEISRMIKYRNSFLPLIKGQITKGMDGRTEILVKMRLWLPVLIFVCFWLGVVGIICIFVAIGLAFEKRNENEFSFAIFIPFIMFIFGYLLTMFGFKSESSQSKKFLQRLAEAEIIN